MENLFWLHLTDSTIPYLAQLLLSLTSAGILLYRARGATASRLLAGFFGGIGGFCLVLLIYSGTYLPILIALQLLPVQLALICLLQFVYRIPYPVPDEAGIARCIFRATLIGCLPFIAFIMAEVFTGMSRSYFLFFYLCLGVIVLEFGLVILILLRRTHHFSTLSRGPSLSFRQALCHPPTVQAQTTRAFALACATPLSVACWALLYQAFLRPAGFFSVSIYTTLLGLFSLGAMFVLVLTYLNRAPEATSFMDKLLLSTLTIVLSVIGVLGQITLIPLQEKMAADEQAWSIQVQETLSSHAGTLNSADLPSAVLLITSHPLALSWGTIQSRLDFARQPEAIDLSTTSRKHTSYFWNNFSQAVQQPESHYMLYRAFIFKGRQYYLGFYPAPYQQLANQQGLPVVWLMLFGTLVIVGLGPLFFRINLVQPLDHLLAGVRQVEAGELAVEVQPRYNDEIGHLTRAFNMMVTAIRDSAQALQQLNAELEQRVADRTMELATTNHELQQHAVALEISHAEIQHLNQRLRAENLRMEAELDVARRIQTMLLPSADELAQITGLEIAAFMQPAEEVGGDYYDVLRHNGRVKIGIGDVTGHGLESGVIMLMLQTAVRTLEIHQEKDPVRFLNTLNQLLYANLQRMNIPRSLSLALLDYQPDCRRLRFSGQHEQLLLLRQGQIEQLDTQDLGFPLGLVTEISDWVGAHPLTLNSGDTVILYSDGIPEAQNPQGDFYGLKRLCEVITTHAGRHPEVIKDGVIADIQAFLGPALPDDDLTLLVLRQK